MFFLNSYDTVDQARLSIGNFINFYNQKRFHQALNYPNPHAVYALKTVPTKLQLFKKFALQNSVKYLSEEKVAASLAREASFNLLSPKKETIYV